LSCLATKFGGGSVTELNHLEVRVSEGGDEDAYLLSVNGQV